MNRTVGILIGAFVVAVLLLAGIGIAVNVSQKKARQKHADAAIADARDAIHSAEVAIAETKFVQARDGLVKAQKRLRDSLASSHPDVEAVDKELTATIRKVSNEESDYKQRVAQGWAIFEGKFISPSEKSQILMQRKAEADARAAAEAREQQRIAEEAKKAEEEQRAKEQAAMEKKAREMYGSYKEAAEGVADSILKLISATQTGISLEKHSEMLQDIQFQFNKFSLSRNDVEKRYESYVEIAACVEYFKLAQKAWNNKLEGIREDYSNEYQQKCEEILQKSWKSGGESYQRFMALLAERK